MSHHQIFSDLAHLQAFVAQFGNRCLDAQHSRLGDCAFASIVLQEENDFYSAIHIVCKENRITAYFKQCYEEKDECGTVSYISDEYPEEFEGLSEQEIAAKIQSILIENIKEAMAKTQSELWQDDANGGDGPHHQHLAILREELRALRGQS